MQKVLKRTTQPLGGDGLDSHYHVVYCDFDARAAFCAPDPVDGHVHEIQYREEQRDPASGVQVQAGGYVVLPHPEDGHTHDLTEYVPEVKERSEKNETKAVHEVLSLFKAGYEEEAASKRDADKAEKFYRGEQWDTALKNKLEDLDRACITVNLIEKNVDELVGHQLSNRRDIRYLPTEEGDQAVADILNVLSKQILDNCEFADEETCTFEDAVVRGRGNFNIFETFEDDIRGEFCIESFPDDEVVYGPHAKKSGSDCEYFVRHKLYSVQKAKHLWQKKAEEIEAQFDAMAGIEDSDALPSDIRPDAHTLNENWKPVTSIGELAVLDIAKKEVRVFECHRIVYEEAFIALNPDADFYVSLHGWRKEDREAVARIPGFKVGKKNVKKIRITKVAGNVLLSDQNPADTFSDELLTFPVYAKKRKKRHWGKVQRVIDIQQEINKRHSQSIDIGNKCAAYGWFVDPGTFPSNKEKEAFKRSSSQPGFVADVNDTNRPPRQVEGVKFPKEIVDLMQLADERMATLMGITVQPGGANESGAMFAHRQQMQFVGNEYLFKNLERAKKKIGKIIISYIQERYTPERIYRILRNKNTQQAPVSVNGRPFDTYTEQEVSTLLTDADLSKYDVTVSEMAQTPTARLSTYMVLRDLAQGGLPIPPEAFIELADLPTEYKQKILGAISAQQQAAQAESQRDSDTEIRKTMIANQGRQQQQGPTPQPPGPGTNGVGR